MAVDIRVTKDNCDFSGWATRYNIKCADGRTIRPGAFKDCDGEQITIVYGHKHGLNDILGHGLLESRPEGIRLYGKFNDTEDGIKAKKLVTNGDIRSLSIWANNLTQRAGDVLHGVIREVSLVMSPANKGAYIDMPVIQHGDDEEVYECFIYFDDAIDDPSGYLAHSATNNGEGGSKNMANERPEENQQETQNTSGEKTVREVFNTLNEEQKKVVYFLIGKAVEDAKAGKGGSAPDEVEHGYYGGVDDMYYNAFEQFTFFKSTVFYLMNRGRHSYRL